MTVKLPESMRVPYVLGLATLLTTLVHGTLASTSDYMASARSMLNPMSMGFTAWISIYLFKQFAIVLVWDNLVTWVVLNFIHIQKMPSRPPRGALTSKHKIKLVDITFLVINSFIEYAFMLHLTRFAWFSGKVSHGVKELTLLNTLVAFCALPMLNDMLYAPAHRILHWKPVYWLVHKHHHGQFLPTRGYIDAANEHPVEQVIGLGLLYSAIFVISSCLGLHSCTLLVYFLLYGVLALLNHTPYDFRIQLPFLSKIGISYSVRAHEMHHRKPNCNYGQHVMVWDKLMGTFKKYEEKM